MEAEAVEGPTRGRAAPDVVVDGSGDRDFALMGADRGAPLVAEGAGRFDPAEPAAAEELDRLSATGRAADLSAGLADLVVMPRRLDEPAAFPDVVADRLLDVDVLARGHRPDSGEAVPVVRRRDRDALDARVVHDPPQVLDELGTDAALGPGDARELVGDDALVLRGGVDVADVRDDAVVLAGDAVDMIATAASDTDDGDVEPFAGSAARGRGRGFLSGRILRDEGSLTRGDGRKAGGTPEEIATIELHEPSS